MPALKKPKREIFAAALAEGKTQVEAQAAAGYKINEGNAGRLNRNEQVQRRVQELQQPVLQKAQLTKELIINGLLEHRALALAQPKPDLSAANRAYELLGRELKMFAERHVHERNDIVDLTRAEILDLILQRRGSGFGDLLNRKDAEESLISFTEYTLPPIPDRKAS